MNAAKIFIALLLLVPTSAGRAKDGATSSSTAPQFLVDARIVDAEHGQLLVAARLYFDTVEQSYHTQTPPRQRGAAEEAQLAILQSDTETRTQQIAILQSAVVRFGIRQLSLSKLDGTEATSDDLCNAIANERAILLLPAGTSLHPGIVATLRPDTLVISKVRPDRPKVVDRPLAR